MWRHTSKKSKLCIQNIDWTIQWITSSCSRHSIIWKSGHVWQIWNNFMSVQLVPHHSGAIADRINWRVVWILLPNLYTVQRIFLILHHEHNIHSDSGIQWNFLRESNIDSTLFQKSEGCFTQFVWKTGRSKWKSNSISTTIPRHYRISFQCAQNKILVVWFCSDVSNIIGSFGDVMALGNRRTNQRWPMSRSTRLMTSSNL